jgi:hypothetical protein
MPVHARSNIERHSPLRPRQDQHHYRGDPPTLPGESTRHPGSWQVGIYPSGGGEFVCLFASVTVEGCSQRSLETGGSFRRRRQVLGDHETRLDRERANCRGQTAARSSSRAHRARPWVSAVVTKPPRQNGPETRTTRLDGFPTRIFCPQVLRRQDVKTEAWPLSTHDISLAASGTPSKLELRPGS